MKLARTRGTGIFLLLFYSSLANAHEHASPSLYFLRCVFVISDKVKATSFIVEFKEKIITQYQCRSISP
ncbi:hypothetical protein [Escherichia coli]|uniref:hypothetical protein n=1 Tax=Escherichia coli TaxID=562 RepID=UPI0010CADD1B|nr:hypothetical protein [Escherichia coli]